MPPEGTSQALWQRPGAGGGCPESPPGRANPGTTGRGNGEAVALGPPPSGAGGVTSSRPTCPAGGADHAVAAVNSVGPLQRPGECRTAGGAAGGGHQGVQPERPARGASEVSG